MQYARADYSVVVKNRAPPPKGVEVGDLPGRKRQPDQAVIDPFRDYGGGQARREGCPQGAVEQALRLTRVSFAVAYTCYWALREYPALRRAVAVREQARSGRTTEERICLCT